MTPELQARLCELLAAGNTRTVAVDLAGISYPTFREWMNAGEVQNSGAFSDFFKAVKKAEAEASVKKVQTVGDAAVGGCTQRTTRTLPDGTVEVSEKFGLPSWQAAAWWLERKLPEDWGRDSLLVKAMQEQAAALKALTESQADIIARLTNGLGPNHASGDEAGPPSSPAIDTDAAGQPQ
jgi:hypothetical protein